MFIGLFFRNLSLLLYGAVVGGSCIGALPKKGGLR